ncbi:MAG TPA: response regulator transcription factor [Ligilactobacillus acidipiscis]|uniref:Response regulator transcription factor n=1 Tax=Ligilactobacillus acidipiscis TaxID=89059 RepID=A0A921K0H9_9LACO|nr:response regulator transcription factor [Ligilactobacillus acidipiscis]
MATHNKIFVIEDDPVLVTSLVEFLQQWGLKGVTVQNFQDIVPDIKKSRPDLILMDIKLPFYDGFYWTNKIREFSTVPIIFISSITDQMNQIMAINLGADDFITKPFNTQMLLAKINATLRRSYQFNSKEVSLQVENFILYPIDNLISYGNTTLELTRNECLILRALFAQPNILVTKEKLMEILWNSDLFIDENTLQVNINRLRKKLSPLGNLSQKISTVRGKGYLLEATNI